MAEEFRESFVGEEGYKILNDLMENGTKFSYNLATCFRERHDAELAYSKALRKISDSLQKNAGDAFGTIQQALSTSSAETSKESDAHSVMANACLNISMRMKNLAETQKTDRKSVEKILGGKFKEWNNEKNKETKYRTSQFEKCKEIEDLNLKICEFAKITKYSTKDSSKEGTVSTPLVMSCVLPGGRHSSNSKKSSSTIDVKHQANMETVLRKAEEELEGIERKYYRATKQVELTRQLCAAEMCRSCDQLQKMELDRISEVGYSISTYANSIRSLSETMCQISHDLYSIKIIPSDDVILEARSNSQNNEIEILLYDIYAEYDQYAMNEQRRILSLMHWIEMLKQDIEAQRRSNSGIIYNGGNLHDRSSSSSNDEDGGMRRGKNRRREKKTDAGNGELSNEIFIDQQNSNLILHLLKASLYKIESVYNRKKKLPVLSYEHANRFALTYTKEGDPKTFLRLPFQISTYTPPSAPPVFGYNAESTIMFPPSAPPAAAAFVTAMPTFSAPTVQPKFCSYARQEETQPIGWKLNPVEMKCSAPAFDDKPQHFVFPQSKTLNTRKTIPKSPYQAPPSALGESLRQSPIEHVKVLYNREPKHDDELNLKEGDIILVLEHRKDQWCRGNLNGHVGLFPGNYVEKV